MALVTGVTYPNNGDRIKAENYNDPIQKIIAQINGNLDSTNILSLVGTKVSNNSLPVAALADDVAAGWFPSSDVLTYASNSGNKEYSVTTPTDKTSKYSAGMKVKVTRAVAPPTQCANLVASSNQYANKVTPAGITFTDDFTVEAYVKLKSYKDGEVLTRWNGTSGWLFRVSSSGTVFIGGFNAGSGNTRQVISYQSLPLNQWVHIAATLDMSGWTSATNKIFINGVDVGASLASGGTNPTALIQAGDLEVGASNGATNAFDGKIADVRLWNTVRSGSQIRDNMNQQLVGNEANLVGYWKLAGNFNDSTSNANNLTAQNSAVATDTDNPMKSTEYADIVSVSYSAPNTTLVLRCPPNYNIPNLALSNFYYSAQERPYGYPPGKQVLGKVRLGGIHGGITSEVDVNGATLTVTVPDGGARLRMTVAMNCACSSANTQNLIAIKEGSNVLRLHQFASPNTSNAFCIPTLVYDFFETAGTHTYKLTAAAPGGGTLQIWASGSSAVWSEFIVETV